MGLAEFVGFTSAIVGIISFIWFIYEKWLPYRNISWGQVQKSARLIADLMTAENFSPSMIMGIGRGGAILGAMVSGALGHRPLVVIDRKYKWSEKGRFEDLVFPVTIPKEYLKKVLLVAGEAHSGGTMELYYDYLRKIGVQDIKRAVLLLEEGCPINIEYYGIKSDKKNIRLPWMFSKQYIRADRTPQKSLESRFRMRIYFVRHAKTIAGEDIFSGSSDADLTVEGVEQATKLGHFFLGKKVDAVYSSPVGRALKTAKILNAFVEAEFIVDERLREINFGAWDGLARSTVQAKYGSIYSEWVNNPSVIPEGGESPDQVLARLQSFLGDIVEKYRLSEGTEIIAVSHKTAIRIMTAFVENGRISGYRDRLINNTEIIPVIFDGKRWSIDAEEP